VHSKWDINLLLSQIDNIDEVKKDAGVVMSFKDNSNHVSIGDSSCCPICLEDWGDLTENNIAKCSPLVCGHGICSVCIMHYLGNRL